jgi:hypothetical protein
VLAGCDLRQANLSDRPFPDQSFDVILGWEVLLAAGVRVDLRKRDAQEHHAWWVSWIRTPTAEPQHPE